MSEQSAVAVITARGGSKRIPGKNIKSFLGKPIICYSIEAALKSGAFSEVMVSTDDEKIAEIAQKAGASVPFLRSAENANDFANTTDVMLEVLQQYAGQGKQFALACCLYPTAPFVTAERLTEAKSLLLEQDADGVMPVVEFGFPPQRGVVEEDGVIRFHQPEYAFSRSQDLKPIYHDAGQFYFFRTERFLSQKKMVLNRMMPIHLSRMEVQDIDTLEDWKLAELKYRLLREGC